MKATDVLQEEHRMIEKVLGSLDEIVRREQWGQFEKGLTFLKMFADKCHHAKEEQCLFPMLEAKGFSKQEGPVGVMLSEHDRGRGYLREMEKMCRAVQGGDRRALAALTDYTQAYIQLLKTHILKEDECLFSMADLVLNEADQKKLLGLFETMENEKIPAGTHELCLKIAEELCHAF